MSSENVIKFCPNCGTKTIPNAKFCIECGYELALIHKNIQESKESITEKNEIIEESRQSNESLTENNEIIEESQDTFGESQEILDDIITHKTAQWESAIQQESTDNPNEILNDNENSNNKQNNFDIIRPTNTSNEASHKKQVKKDFNLLNQTQKTNNNIQYNEQPPMELGNTDCPSCGNRMQTSQKSGLFSKSTYHICNNCRLTFKENNEYLVMEDEPEFTRFRSKLHLKRFTGQQWKEILDGNYTPDEVSKITSWKFDGQTNITCPACNHELTKYKTGGFVSYYLVCEYCNLILEEHKDEKYTLFNSTETYSPLWYYEKNLLTIAELQGIFGTESTEKKKQREITVKQNEERFQEQERQLKQQQEDMILFSNSLENGTPMLVAPTDTTIVLKKNEKPVYKINNVSLLEPRAVRTSTGGYGGTSVRITKGVTLHSGRTARKSESHDEIKVIDSGDLLITNQRIIFLGHNRTTNIDIKKIISITSEQNMIQIQRSNKQKPEYFTNVKSSRQVNIDSRIYNIDVDGDMLRKLILGLI